MDDLLGLDECKEAGLHMQTCNPAGYCTRCGWKSMQTADPAEIAASTT